jgi:hypothetical protein
VAQPSDSHLHTPSEVTPVHIYVCGTGTDDICRAVNHDDITEPKGSITPRHSEVRPTFHSGQYGLSTCHQSTMAGHEQDKKTNLGDDHEDDCYRPYRPVSSERGCDVGQRGRRRRVRPSHHCRAARLAQLTSPPTQGSRRWEPYLALPRLVAQGFFVPREVRRGPSPSTRVRASWRGYRWAGAGSRRLSPRQRHPCSTPKLSREAACRLKACLRSNTAHPGYRAMTVRSPPGRRA